MKKIVATFALLIGFSGFLLSQSQLHFSENFETNTLPDSVNYIGSGQHGHSQILFSEGAKSDSLRIQNLGDSIKLITQSFSTSSYPFVYLKFDHICKIEFYDEAFIEVSANNGASWTRLTGTNYLGLGQFTNIGNKFTSISYINDWQPGTYTKPTNEWWKSEKFDMSALVGNSPNVMVRFVLKDANANGQQSDNYAWFIDNIKVLGSLYEVTPPFISLLAPIQQDTITSANPYVIKAFITDASTIDTAYVAYSVNTNFYDTIGMIKIGPDSFQAIIPFHGFGRTIHYKVIAKDKSLAINYSSYPEIGSKMIYAKYTTEYVFEFGNGLTSGYMNGPVYRNDASGSFNYSLYAYMLRSSELASAGVPLNSFIKKIEWFKTNGNSTNGNAVFKIFLKNSSQRIWPTGYNTLAWDTISTGSTQVYGSTTQQITNSIGWYPFNLTPYQYTGNDLEISTFWDISMVTNPKATGQITWAYTSGFSETRTMGNGASSPPAVVAAFSYGGAVRASMRLTVEVPYSLTTDAGIAQIINPTGSVQAGNSFSVVTKLKNFGVNNLTSCLVKWSVDGINQTPYSFTGSLSQDAISNQITLGNLTLPNGIHRIKIWTESPNNLSDMNIENDTMQLTFMSCNGLMSGTYSVGTVSSDFYTIEDAILALSQCGVSGPVVMNIASGIYDEQIVIPLISGTNATNTITFKSSADDSTKVLIRHSSPAFANYVVQFNGAKYITFKHVSFKTLEPFNGKVITFINHCSNVAIKNCELFGLNSNLTTDDQSLIVSFEGGIDSAFVLYNTKLNDGYNALVLRGLNTDTLISNVKIDNNVFLNQYLVAANLQAISALEFTHNIVRVSNALLAPQGVNLVKIKNKWKFTHNTIDLASGARAVSIWNCNSSFGNEALFVNNMISQGGSFVVNLIDLNNSTAIRFLNNNFHKYANTNGNVLGITTGAGNEVTDSLYFQNNIFVNSAASGQLLSINPAIGARKIFFNYNDYYTNSTNFASNASTTVPNFNAWKAAINQDVNSINENPAFASLNNLHIINYALKGLANPSLFVTDDIDGKLRTNTPTIGAHELIDLTHDLNVVSLLSPSSACGLGNNETVKVRVINNGLNTINTPFNLSFSNGGLPTTETISQTLAIGDTLDYTFSAKLNLSIGNLATDSIFTVKVWANYNLDQFVFNDTVKAFVTSGYKTPIPTAGTFSTNYGSTATLTANSVNTLFWFSTNSSQTISFIGNNFVTPILYDTTTFWVATKSLNGMGCYSDLLPIQVNVVNFPANDAGIESVVMPVGEIQSKTATALKVNLKNYGTQNLNSVKIKYSLNGILQDSILWNGNLTNGSTEVVTVDSLIIAGGLYTLKVWSNSPNGSTDLIALNDTSITTLRACLQGNYTIGKIGGAQTYDYNTFSSAINALVTGGVCGNVTFTADTGTYTEKLLFKAIPGAGSNAKITFTSLTGDSTSVKIKYSLVAGDSAIVIMRSASYIAFKKLGFYVTGATGTFSRIFQFESNSNYNTLENCHLEGFVTTSTSNNYACVASLNHTNHYNTFTNNRVKYGSNGFYYNGITTGYSKGTLIKNNVVSDYVFAGILSGYQDSLQIISNKLTKVIATGNYQGITASNVTGGLNISFNSIDNSTATYSTGIQLQNITGSASAKCIISNNMVTAVSGGTSSAGMNLTACNYVDFYYNSINMVGNGNFGRGVTFNNCSGINFKNNIIKTRQSHVLYFTNTTTFLSSDYNCYYNGGSAFAFITSDILNLDTYKANTGREQHSLFSSAQFVTDFNLHLQNTALSGKGTPIPEVPLDFDLQSRNVYPTIGADEVALPSKDIAVLSVIFPNLSTVELDTIYPKIVLKNVGMDTITSIPISYSINNGTPVNFLYTGTLSLFETDTVVLPYFISVSGNYNLCVSANLVGDTSIANNESCKVIFGTPAFDASLIRILPIASNCNLTTDSVRIGIKNNGSLPINGGFIAKYQVNGIGNIVSQAVTSVIAVGDSLVFTFSTPINFTGTGQDSLFKINAWLQLTGDNISFNDSLSTSTLSLASPASPIVSSVSIPYASQAVLQVATVQDVNMRWYNNEIGGNYFLQNNTYTSPIMYFSDTLWVEAKRKPIFKDTVLLGNQSFYNSPTNWPTPYGNYAYGNKEQYLLTAAELKAMGGTAGLISSLAFNVKDVNDCPILYNYQIRMTQTSATAMTGWIPGIFTSVFATTTYQPIYGWNTHVFQSPFVWDGLSNVVVEVCFTNSTSVTNGNASVYYSNTPVNSVARYSGNYANLCSAPATYSLGVARPNMKMEFAFDGCTSARIPVYINVSNQPSSDIGISQIVKPFSAKNLGSADTVQVVVKNYGSLAQSNFAVNLKVNNEPIITEILPNTLNSGDSILYTFNTKLNLSTAGATYKLIAFTNLLGDTIQLNDSIKKSVTHLLSGYCTSSSTDPDLVDITNVSVYTLNNNSAAVGSMYSDFSGLVEAPSFSLGTTYTISVSSAIPPGGGTLNSTWVKAWIDFNADSVFDLNEVILSTTASTVGIVSGTFVVPGNAINGNTLMRVVLSRYGTATSVNPCGTYNYGETEDYIVSILNQIKCDAGVNSILNPAISEVQGSVKPVWVKFYNYGMDTIQPNTLSVAYKLNNGSAVVLPYTNALLPLTYDSLNMGNIVVPAGKNTICAYTILSCDSLANNNEVCKDVFGTSVFTIPFADNFDSLDFWYTDNSALWQKGIPAGNSIASAPSNPNVWMTELNSNYPLNTVNYLFSPYFDFSNLSQLDTAQIKFWHSLNSETNFDGGSVQYSLDSGITWVNLGYKNDTLAQNWYNTSVSGFHCWTGDIAWQEAKYNLDPNVFNQANPVKFRFRFFSNGSNNNFDGWAIDNFKIILIPSPIDAKLDSILSPTQTTFGVLSTVSIRIKNEGTNALLSIPVHYSLNGANSVYETWNGNLASGATTTYTFTQGFTPTFSSQNFSLCAAVKAFGDSYVQNDSLCFTISQQAPALDAGIIRIESPAADTTFLNNPITVKVWIKNFGSSPLNSINLQYKAGIQPIVSGVWSGNLIPGDSVLYTFSQTYMPQPAYYQLCAKTVLANDAIAANDEICKNKIGSIGMNENWNQLFSLNQNIPNPASRFTTLQFSVPYSGKLDFRITDLVGRALIQQFIDADYGSNTIEIDANQLTNGVYFYSIEMDGHKLVKKMIISH